MSAVKAAMSDPLRSASHYFSRTFNHIVDPGVELEGCEFEECEFRECNFTEALFRRCRFIDCTFTRCNLSLLKVAQSGFTGVSFDECKLVGVDWTRAAWPRLVFSSSLAFSHCILNDSSFFGLELDEIVLEACKAHDVDFREGSFCRARFVDTDLTHSLFGKTNLTQADFTDASHYDIDIFNNRLSQAKFSRYEAIRLLDSLDIELVE